jgi:hypothetical protein
LGYRLSAVQWPRTVPIFQGATHCTYLNTYKVITPKSFFFANQPIWLEEGRKKKLRVSALRLSRFYYFRNNFGELPLPTKPAFELRVGLALAKAAALRITLNLDGATITCKSHTHPSHSETSRLLTSSLSLGVPVPRGTQCM